MEIFLHRLTWIRGALLHTTVEVELRKSLCLMGMGVLWVLLHSDKLCNKNVFLEVNVSHRGFVPPVSIHWDQTELS